MFRRPCFQHLADDFAGGEYFAERCLRVVEVAAVREQRDAGKDVAILVDELLDLIPFVVLDRDGVGDVVAEPGLGAQFGALAGVDAVYDAAFQRAGILRVYDLDEVFDAVETLSTRPRVTGDRLVIVTNGGGVGVLAVDALSDYKGTLAELTQKTIADLNAVLPPTWSHANPIDIIGDAGGERYAAALNAIAEAPNTDGVLVLRCPVAVASGVEAAQATIDAVKSSERPVLTSWLGSGENVEARHMFQAAHIPTYDTPEKAVRGFMHLARYARGQNVILEVPA